MKRLSKLFTLIFTAVFCIVCFSSDLDAKRGGRAHHRNQKALHERAAEHHGQAREAHLKAASYHDAAENSSAEERERHHHKAKQHARKAADSGNKAGVLKEILDVAEKILLPAYLVKDLLSFL